MGEGRIGKKKQIPHPQKAQVRHDIFGGITDEIEQDGISGER
jgi:hypothetical protein